MGTNYRRIPKSEVIRNKQAKLTERVVKLDTSELSDIGAGFRTIGKGWDMMSPWDEFIEGMDIHLGKRSSGWKFCWNFHENKYYSNKDELIEFILSGRIVNEYGEETINPQDFLDMAFEWGQPDGLSVNEEYYKSKEQDSFFNDPKYYDTIIDGLCVSSSTEFS